MLKIKIIFYSLIFASFTLTGCGPSYHYKYSAPKGAEGSNCVQRCSEIRNQCRAASDLEEKNNEALAIANQRSYQSCAAGRSKKDVKKYCSWAGGSFSDNTRFDFPNDNTCESDFNQCFEICGGAIERILLQ